VANTENPPDDENDNRIDPANEPATDNADGAHEIGGRTEAQRELTERVQRKIKSIGPKTKRYLN
jgi:hypothetical protein